MTIRFDDSRVEGAGTIVNGIRVHFACNGLARRAAADQNILHGGSLHATSTSVTENLVSDSLHSRYALCPAPHDKSILGFQSIRVFVS